MSVKTFLASTGSKKGSYTFDFAKEEDCQYFLDQYDGEGALKSNFPEIYKTFLRTKEQARLGNVHHEGICYGDLGKLFCKGVNSGSDMSNNDYVSLITPLNLNLIDNTKSVDSDASASPWVGTTVKVAVKKANETRYLVRTSEIDTITNSNNLEFSTQAMKLSDVNDNKIESTITVMGKAADSFLSQTIITNSYDLGNVKEYTIDDIRIDDPFPRGGKHNDQIMMLYGRTSEQDIYKDADYRGDDFLDNVFKEGKVHLLIPITGVITFNYNVKPRGLYYNKAEGLTRSNATYDYKKQVFTYREDIRDDAELYKKLKDKFIADEYSPTLKNKVKFDISIKEWGRSKYDWHCDVQGIQNGDPKTVYIDAAFTYGVYNQKGKPVEEQIQIKSVDPGPLKDVHKRAYYEYVKGSNVVYIPPITIYWGCFGKDVKIMLADNTVKNASEIKAGDKVRGHEGQVLTVEEVVTGYDQSIFNIKTKNHGEIKVSGGHPMMSDGQCIRAAKLQRGDKLNLPNGELAEIVSIDVVPYNDTVYNFTFEECTKGTYIIANGFCCGDLKMQNRKKEKTAPVLSAEDLAFIEEAQRFHNTMSDTFLNM